jgi:tetratricopeptide (TPR) repeat protein
VIEACQRALAGSRDKLTTVIAIGVRGVVLLWKGDVNDAVPALEESTRFFREIGYGFAESLLAGWLGEALCATGQLDKAREVALRGLTAGRAAQARSQAATSERNLGLIDQAEGALAEAQSHFEAALTTFLAVEARFEAGRTHLDLATLAHARGDAEAARTHSPALAPLSWRLACRCTSSVLSRPRYGWGSRSRPSRRLDSCMTHPGWAKWGLPREPSPVARHDLVADDLLPRPDLMLDRNTVPSAASAGRSELTSLFV